MIANYLHVEGTETDRKGQTTIGVHEVKTRWWYSFVEWITWPAWLRLFFLRRGLYLRKLTESELAEIGPIWYSHGGMTWAFEE